MPRLASEQWDVAPWVHYISNAQHTGPAGGWAELANHEDKRASQREPVSRCVVFLCFRFGLFGLSAPRLPLVCHSNFHFLVNVLGKKEEWASNPGNKALFTEQFPTT
jgi:hypothetical protein